MYRSANWLKIRVHYLYIQFDVDSTRSSLLYFIYLFFLKKGRSVIHYFVECGFSFSEVDR